MKNNHIFITSHCLPASCFLSNHSATQISPSRSFFLPYVILQRHFKCGLLRIGPLTCSSNFRVIGNDMRDLRLASPGGHSTQRLISPIGHLRVSALNDHRVSSPSDSEIRVHSPSKFFLRIYNLSTRRSTLPRNIHGNFSSSRRPDGKAISR